MIGESEWAVRFGVASTRHLIMKRTIPWMFRAATMSCNVMILMSLTGCGPRTKISSEWKAPDVQPTPFNKVVAIAMSSDNIVRRVAEREFVSQLPKQTEGVAGYTLIPETDRGDVDKVRAILADAQVDGATVFRLVGADTALQYNRGTVYYNFYGYYGWAWPMVIDPGYMMTEQVIRVESLLYSVESGELLWSGMSETTNPDSAKTVVDDVVRAVARRMKAMGYVK